MLPRGLRNNNPLNIRKGCKWEGEINLPNEKDFVTFGSIFYGLRAGFILLRRYIQVYHLDTIREIVSRWAPSNENNTSNYIKVVSERMGVSQLQKISFEDKKTMIALVDAMILVECGCTVANDTIEYAYNYVRTRK